MSGWRERAAVYLGLRERPEIDPTYRAWGLVAIVAGVLVGAPGGWAGWLVGLVFAVTFSMVVNRYLLGAWRPEEASEVIRPTGRERWVVLALRHRVLASLSVVVLVAAVSYVVHGAIGSGWGIEPLVHRAAPLLVVLGPFVWWALDQTRLVRDGGGPAPSATPEDR